MEGEAVRVVVEVVISLVLEEEMVTKASALSFFRSFFASGVGVGGV